MGKRIQMEFSGTDEAELAAWQLSSAGIQLLSRNVQPVVIADALQEPLSLQSAPPPTLGSYRTLFAGEQLHAARPKIGGSVTLTVEVDASQQTEAERILRSRRGLKMTHLS